MPHIKRYTTPVSVKAIVIDLDGTLLHTAPELSEAANRMLRDIDYAPVSQELLASYIGNGISWLVKRALTGDMHATPDAALYDYALPIFEKHYTELLLQSRVFDGVIEGLEAMKAALHHATAEGHWSCQVFRNRGGRRHPAGKKTASHALAARRKILRCSYRTTAADRRLAQ
jgi:phosphoglycolate phosphatase-like HAD superfamily hydrolase